MPSQPENNDPLDALLRENDPYVDDAGFTARVMTSLPPRRRAWLRPLILCGAISLSIGLLVWFAPLLKGILEIDATGRIALNLTIDSAMMLGVMLAGAASVAWGMFAILRWEE